VNTADIIALCTGLPTVIAAIAAAVVTILNRNKTIDNGVKIAEVHVMVNSQKTEMMNEIASLKSALVAAKTSPAEGAADAS
jgi:hypothetical protein